MNRSAAKGIPEPWLEGGAELGEGIWVRMCRHVAAWDWGAVVLRLAPQALGFRCFAAGRRKAVCGAMR